MRPQPHVMALAALLVVACAAPQPGSQAPRSAPSEEPPARTLVVATDANVDGFGEMFAGGKSGPEELQAMVHRVLAEADAQGTYVPGIATKLPSLDDGTWKLRSDGGSETIWSLQPNARWHDGTPLTADDIVFSWQVAIAPDVPYKSRQAVNRIEDVETVDAHTVSIRWKSVFVGAGRLTERDLFVLPKHILDPLFTGDRNAFVNATYWSSAFVGLGPFRIVDWVPGSQVQLQAFDGFFSGRPPISSILFKTVPDVNTAVANIRAGDIDVWLGSSFGLEHARTLKDDWESTGAGRVMTYPRLIFEIRLRPEDAKVSDVRMRKALYQTIDRESIVRDLYFGLLQVANSYIAPGTTGFERIEAGLVKYPFDPTGAQALLADLGWRKGADGLLRNDRGERFALPFSTTSGNREREELQAVIADMWKAAGFDVAFENVPLSVQSDPTYVFSTTDLSGISTDFEANIPRIDGRNRRTPQNPRGANVWGYANDDVDQLLDEWGRTLERERQIEIEAAVMRHVSEDLPILPINYRIEAITVANGVSGVPPRSSVQSATNTWNVETWQRTR
ncbi:MAG TPA: peptide ABC transporter substrate-binding protein [Chloroflexota bacterium]|nr:peptide ABC transporter substrate-binding protein [Chloroflexota bacterium]